MLYDQSSIYILYLFNRPGNDPSPQTWGKYKAENFEGRYLVLSYKQDIIPWLKTFLKKHKGTEEKTKVLREGVAQYLDYLRLLFKIDRYTTMKSELTQFLENELKLGSFQEPIALLEDKLKSIDELRAEVKRLLKYYRIKAWGKDTEREYRSAKVFIDAEIGKRYTKFGIHYQLEGARFVALAEYDIEEDYVLVGLGCHQGASEKRLSNLIKAFENGPKKEDKPAKGWKTKSQYNKLWYGWYKVEPEEAMAKFNELVRYLESIEAEMELR